jgi:hypothetical protein
MTKKTHDLDAAARILGISKEALRKRLRRGTIEAKKDKAGRWQVVLDEGAGDKGQDGGGDVSGQLVQQLKSENDFLRQQLHQQSIIIYNLSEGIKLLEAPKSKRPWYKNIFSKEGGE